MSEASVLIVEDNAASRKVMRVTLHAEGYAVLEAEDGRSAVRLAAAHSPSLVLLDCKLPDIDGVEVARQMRAHDPTLPIVAVTGRALDDAAAFGFLDVILKPIEIADLIELVGRHVKRGNGTGHGPLGEPPSR